MSFHPGHRFALACIPLTLLAASFAGAGCSSAAATDPGGLTNGPGAGGAGAGQGAGGNNGQQQGQGGQSPGAGGDGSSGAGGAPVGGGGMGIGTGMGGSAQGGGTTTLYAHTDTTLYQLDPKNLAAAPQMIGAFDCIGTGGDTSMTDFAVDQGGVLWGISAKNVYRLEVQGQTVHCAQTIPLNNASGAVFYALGMAPVGTLDPAKEVLVAGNTAGELWAVDPSGNLTQHGTFGVVPNQDKSGNSYPNAGKKWELSGDIVFLANNGNPVGFATLRDCPKPPKSTGCNTTDTLVEIDMNAFKTAGTQSVTKFVRGQIVEGGNCNAGTAKTYGEVFGIAALGKSIYGFSRSGAILEISNVDGTACEIQPFNDKWSGAGVTTVAPIVAPPALQ